MKIDSDFIIQIYFVFTLFSLGASRPQVSGCTLNRMPALAEGSTASLPLATLLHLNSMAIEKTA
jgi:hypothetical protein